MSDVEIADLEELVSGKGWAWLRSVIQQEYGAEALVDEVRRINLASESPELKQVRIDRAFGMRTAALELLELPTREIQKRRESLAASRPDAFQGERRRGGTL